MSKNSRKGGSRLQKRSFRGWLSVRSHQYLLVILAIILVLVVGAVMAASI